jgi:hypothetical protein
LPFGFILACKLCFCLKSACSEVKPLRVRLAWCLASLLAKEPFWPEFFLSLDELEALFFLFAIFTLFSSFGGLAGAN